MSYCDDDKCVVPTEYNMDDLTVTMKVPNNELKEFIMALMTAFMKQLLAKGHIQGWRYV